MGRAEHLDDRDVEAEAAGDRGDLGSDKAGADHRQPPGRAEPVPQREAVRHGPEGEHAVEGQVAPRVDRGRPGGDDEAVVPGPGAPGEHDLAGPEVEAHRALAEPQVEVEAGVHPQPGHGRVGRADEDFLGQRRAFVGRQLFLAEQGDPALEAGPAQRAGGTQPRR
jgi:hypothetical protein